MPDLAAQIRERLDRQEAIIKGADNGVLRPLDEADQWKAALLAVLDVAAELTDATDCECPYCVRKRVHAAIAEKLGIEVDRG